MSSLEEFTDEQYFLCLEKILSKNECDVNNFEEALQEKVSQLKSHLGVDCFETLLVNNGYERTVSDFCCVVLALLQQLQKYLSTLTKNNVAVLMSVPQKRLLKSSVQLVVVVGLLPYLEEGVGVPVEVRTKTASSEHLSTSKNKQMDGLQRRLKLEQCCRGLLELLKQPDIGEIIINTHLVDLIAALLQLTFGPVRNDQERKWFGGQLQKLLSNLHQPTVIKQIMLLMGMEQKPCGSQFRIPIWLLKACGRLLTERLKSPGGVLAMVKCVTDSEDSESSRDISILAKVIASPFAKPNAHKYAAVICPQVVNMLTMKQPYVRETVQLIKAFAFTDVQLTYEFIFSKIFHPLLFVHIKDDEHFATEEELEDCVKYLTWIFVEHTDPDEKLLREMTPIILPLFHMHVFIKNSASHLRGPVSQLLERYFKHADAELVRKLADALVYDKEHPSISLQRTDIAFKFGASGGVTINKGTTTEEFIPCLVSLLLLSSHKDVVCPLYLQLLERLCDYLGTSDYDNRSLVRVKLRVLELLQELSESDEMLNNIITNHLDSTFSLIQTLLSDVGSNSDILVAALGILTLMLSQIKQNQWNSCSPLIDSLSRLESIHPSELVRNMATQVKCVLATRGTVSEQPDSQKQPKPKSASAYSAALEDACSPLIPVRGHGLLALSKLLENKDKDAMDNRETLLNIFQDSLKDEDSYVYLMAIEDLVSLCNRFPDVIIPHLTEMYIISTCELFRMKVGEVLCRTTKRLGQLSVHYSHQLIHAFFVAAKNPDPLIHRSALSNLGELCQRLGFSLVVYMQEILCLLRSNLSCEQVGPAAMLIASLLDAITPEQIINMASELRELHKLLQSLSNRCEDKIGHLHISIARTKLNDLMKAVLTPSPKLQKKIHVIDKFV